MCALKNRPTRRDFLKLSFTGALGTFGLSQIGCTSAAPSKSASSGASFGNAATESSVDSGTATPPESHREKIGLQLYTIRDAMANDVPGSLKQVADVGYDFVELAGYSDGHFYGYEPDVFARMVTDFGMTIVSSHTQVEAEGITLDNAKKMAADHVAVGVKYCIQPWIVAEARNLDSYKKMAADWNRVGEIMKEHDIQFGYHNHNFEFETVEGQVPYYDILLAELDRALVTMELDLFWAAKAGQDPIEMFKKYPGRFELFHLKDMYTANETSFTPASDDFAPVGEGVLDFKAFLAAKETAGLKYMIVEQDSTKDGRPFEAIETSYKNLINDILV